MEFSKKEVFEIKKASHFCEAFTSVGPEGFEPYL